MNNTFNFGRFSKVFAYDLHKSVQNYGLSFIVLALLPLLTPLLYGLMSLFFSFDWQVPGLIARCVIFILAVAYVSLTFAPGVYGKITDKRYGSEYLMIPASSFEKFLSMTLITAVIVPLVFTIAYGLVDLLAIGVSLAEGTPLLKFFVQNWVIAEDGAAVQMGWIITLGLMLNTLVILLGSIYFKKFKIGKTILASFAVSTVLSFIMVPLFNMIIGNPDMLTIVAEDVEEWIFSHADKIELYLNAFIDVTYLVQYSVILVLTYIRVRTLKH